MSAGPDTIFAVATAPGRAGVAIIRVSGRGASSTIEALTRRGVPTERQAVYRELFDFANNSLIDAGLVLFFRGPYSYTGEDSVEFHVHGGRAIVGAILEALARSGRLAPGRAS